MYLKVNHTFYKVKKQTSTFLFKGSFIAYFFLFFLCIPFIAQSQPNDKPLKEALVNGITLGIPGISVAIGKGDSIVWAGTAGYSDLTSKSLLKKNSQFGVGSITKTFVAVVILQLVEEGRLDLNKVPADYLDLSVIKSVPNSDKATLRQLLNHQSGIPTWEFQADWIRKGRGSEMDVDHIWSKTETLHYIQDLPPDFEPGERYAYSNTNYTLLGLIIEKITGNDLMVEIRKRIFQPLGIKNTFLNSFEDTGKEFVHHYHYATPQFGTIAGIHKAFPEIRPYLVESTPANLSPEWAAGGMVSTASDLVKWVQGLRAGTLLGSTMGEELFTYYPPKEISPSPLNYMQGIYKLKNYYKGKAVIGHSGGTLGFSAHMFWIENTDIVIVFLANVGNMHSGLKQAPPSLFYKNILFPAVLKYLNFKINQ